MSRLLRFMTLLFAVLLAAPVHAQDSGEERRLALVIGNGEYQSGPLKTAANDAGLIAQTLQAAGFDVTGARDLDGETMRDSVREFLDKVRDAGPSAVSFVYFSGRALQFEGENYLLPIDARITKDTDIPLAGFRLADLTKPLGSTGGKAKIVVLDAARLPPASYPKDGIAGGLALVQPEPGMLLAYNAAPGTVGPDEDGSYGSYASALAEMIKTGDFALDDVFSRARMRVSDLTKGQQLPWSSSRVLVPVRFFEQSDEATPASRDKFDDLKSRPLREFSAEDAYQAALARDSFAGYQEFLAAYPKDPLAKRVRAILAARRESMTWRETVLIDTPEAYWSYLRRYPEGPHAYEAHRRLRYLDVAYDPPSRFTEIYYDVPAPYDDEVIFIRRRHVVYFGDPYYDFPPPPLISIVFLLARPTYFIALAPPPPPPLYMLPMPIYYPVPIWVRRPHYVAPPPPSLISINIYNKVETPRHGEPIVTSPKGERIPVRDFKPAFQKDGAPSGTDKTDPKSDSPRLGVGLPGAAERKIKRLPKDEKPDTQQQGGGAQSPDVKIPKEKKLPGFTPEQNETLKNGRNDKNKRTPKEQGSPESLTAPQPQEQPKVKNLPKVQDAPKLRDLPKSRELPKSEDSQTQPVPKRQDIPKTRLPKTQDEPKLREQRKLQEPVQPRIKEQPQFKAPNAQGQSQEQRKKQCGKPGLPPCD